VVDFATVKASNSNSFQYRVLLAVYFWFSKPATYFVSIDEHQICRAQVVGNCLPNAQRRAYGLQM
jgi:hypothetical protein